jgi:hypothetical protein
MTEVKPSRLSVITASRPERQETVRKACEALGQGTSSSNGDICVANIVPEFLRQPELIGWDY